jgi:hypothetical protein
MLRLRGMMLLAALSGIVGTVGIARGATTLQGVDFSTMITPNQNISDSIFHYGVTGSPTGGSFGLGNYPANQYGTNQQIIQIAGGVRSLLPTYTYFGLYSVQIGTNGPITYGIAVAINNASYSTAAGETFDQLFQTNVDAAYNDGNLHTEADLVTQFLNNGVADSAFTTGITNTSAADIPYGQIAPLVLFSTGTLGGTIEATTTDVPEPMSASLLSFGGMLLLSRRRNPMGV